MAATAWSLYVVGLIVAIGAATATVVHGWAAVGLLIVGLGVFSLGIVVEERRVH